MIRLSGICTLLLFITLQSFAIDASVNHGLLYKFDSAGKTYTPTLELYWQINPRSLHFVTNTSKKIIARIKTDIFIYEDAGLIKEDHFIAQTNPRSNVDELTSLNILELRKYAVKNGKLKLKFILTDVNDSGSVFNYEDSLVVNQDLGKPFYSDIQLLDTFFSFPNLTPFEKNGKQHIPLCANFLDDNKRTLHYYAELNNIESVKPDHYPLVHKLRIAKKQNDGYFPEMGTSDTILSKRVPDILGSIPIGKLTSGNYYVVASLEDKYGVLLATNSCFFQRMNLHPEKSTVEKKVIKEVLADSAMEHVTLLNLDKTFMSKYSLAQVRAILKMLLPVSDPMQTSTINNFLKNPDEMYMRYYVYNYFLAINEKEPAKAWKEYSDKVMDVNKKFTAQGTAGYETERGFIYLRYGVPTDIITVTNETGALPYEIWQYNNLTQFSNKKELTNSLFLFYKPGQMIGDYRLLHSTVSGEMINAAWRMYLYATTSSSSGSGINTNSRAEQYFGNR
jgi:GWxTD domain-containing protein